MSQAAAIETDALIVGAGPAGLFLAFQLALQEIGCRIVDALPYAGGQCVELYADKPIYDIPGIAVCSGRELAENLLRQIAPFKIPLHLGRQVETLQREADGRFLVGCDRGEQFLARTVFIAAGVGAFVPRRPALEGLEAFEGTQVHYHAVESERLAGQRVVVLGGEAAAETALALAGSGRCASVTLLHRTDRFRLEPPLQQALEDSIASGELRLQVGQPLAIDARDGRLEALQVATPSDEALRLEVDALLPRLGLSPKLGPIADWGLALERKLLQVDAATFATSEAGVYAVGDIAGYPGKRKLIVCGFHEATLAAFAAAAWLRPDQRQLLQYTTTSPRLHQLLGVATPGR